MVLSKLMWAGFKAFIIAMILTPIVRDIFRAYNVVDRPGRRKVHAYPIPRVGGAPIAIAWTIAVIGLLDARNPAPGASEALRLIPGAVLIFFTGLFDDFLTLKPFVKLGGQIVAAAAVFANGLRVDRLAGHALPVAVSLPLTIFWLLLTTNAMNLIDGLDGLCAGLAFIGTMTYFAAGLIGGNSALIFTTLPLAGALLGFLLFNFNPATVFLGDAGALSVGFVLGCAGLIWTAHAETLASALVPLLALSLPLTDVALSVLRRFLKNQPIFSADRGHIHHRVLDRSGSPRRAALTLYLMALPGAGAAILLGSPAMPRYFHALAVLVFCAGAWAGIRQLRYPEFEVAAHLLFHGEFRKVLASRARLKQLSTALQRAKSEDDWWKVLLEAGREAGWTRLVWNRPGAAREQVLADRAPDWTFTVTLTPGESLRLEGGASATGQGLDLVAVSGIIGGSFAACRAEWVIPALS